MFLTIFRRHFKSCPKAIQMFPNIFRNFRKQPKIAEHKESNMISNIASSILLWNYQLSIPAFPNAGNPCTKPQTRL